MSVEAQLPEVLRREANRTPHDAGDLGEVRRRGRRRRRARTGATGLASAAALTVVAVLVVAVGPVGPPGPVITPISPGALGDAALVLCDMPQCPTATDAQLEDLERELASDPNVISYHFETPDQTRDRFIAALDNRPELADSLDVDNLPQTIGLRVADVTELDRYIGQPGVDRVIVAQGLPLPLTREQIIAELRDSGEVAPGLQILHVEVVDQSLVVVAERSATASEREFSDRRGLLYRWEPDPDAMSTWRPVSGGNVLIGPDGWTATDVLADGARVLAWGSVTNPTARIDLPGSLLRAGFTYDINAPSGLAIIEGDGDPTIVTD